MISKRKKLSEAEKQAREQKKAANAERKQLRAKAILFVMFALVQNLCVFRCPRKTRKLKAKRITQSSRLHAKSAGPK